MKSLLISIYIFAVVLVCTSPVAAQNQSMGIFEGKTDVGDIINQGSVIFNPESKTYLIAGSGQNMWFAKDAFHFVWKKSSGDISIASGINFTDSLGNNHKKAGVMIRESLDEDSPYIDAVIHGDGLTSMQFREVKGGPTREIQSMVKGPKKIKIQKEGGVIFMSVGSDNETLNPSGGSFKIKFKEPFYIGLFVCAHEKNDLKKALFSDVEISNIAKADKGEKVVESTIETISIESKDRKAKYVSDNNLEGVFWSADNDHLIFTEQGQLFSIPLNGGKPQLVNTGLKGHGGGNGYSPDKKLMAFTGYSEDHQPKVYIKPVDGGEPKALTQNSPSWWHSWSPDGSTLLFVGKRNDNYDIFSIPANGGSEIRLTTNPGIDDGPEYSADGKYIYFNSDRSGRNQIWRMKSDGSSPEQITFDKYDNWYPHVSPDGKWIVFLTYEKNFKGHPQYEDVMLRLMPSAGGEIDVLAKLLGGQGTFDINSWASDSKNLSFVSYRIKHK